LFAQLQQTPAATEESRQFELAAERQAFLWAADKIRDRFDTKTWQAFWQTAVEQRCAADVAAALGVSRGSVYVARSRIMARLKDTIRHLELADFDPEHSPNPPSSGCEMPAGSKMPTGPKMSKGGKP
jgi:RNA polymerase sigma-70 factor (ECF subfamily)